MTEVFTVTIRVQMPRSYNKAGTGKKKRRCTQEITRRMNCQVAAADKQEGRVKDTLQMCSLEAKTRAVIYSWERQKADHSCEE